MNAPETVRSGFLRARRVLTMDGSARGDALWWQDGRVRQVGDAAAVARLVPPGTLTFDLPGAIVTPGFVDGHTHFAMWALGRRRVQLAGARTRAEALARVGAAAPVQGWVLGQGWDSNGWGDAPERTVLDDVHRGPVYLDSLDVHAAWVNSAALAAAGITRATPDPFGGRIVRDIEEGKGVTASQPDVVRQAVLIDGQRPIGEVRLCKRDRRAVPHDGVRRDRHTRREQRGSHKQRHQRSSSGESHVLPPRMHCR